MLLFSVFSFFESCIYVVVTVHLIILSLSDLIEENVVICSKASHIHRPFVIGMALVNTGVSL